MRRQDISTDQTQRILILYALSKIGYGISREAFAPILLSSGGNWIDLQIAVDSLIEDGLVRETDGELALAPDAYEVIHVFVPKADDEKLSAIDAYLKAHQAEIRDRFQVQAYYRENGSSYLVALKILEFQKTVLSVELNAPSRESAQNICRNFRDHADTIYTQIIESLTMVQY